MSSASFNFVQHFDLRKRNDPMPHSVQDALRKNYSVMTDSPNHFSNIVKPDYVCGGDARIANTRITVWHLEEMRRAGVTDAGILRAFPQLTPLDLSNAWAYVVSNLSEIEALIEDNAQAIEEQA